MKSRTALRIGGFMLRLAFNFFCRKAGPAREAAVAAVSPKTRPVLAQAAGLLRRFNGYSNGDVTFFDEAQREDERRAARIEYLEAFLRDVLRLIADGAAGIGEALAALSELEGLGVRVSGLLDSLFAAHATKIPELRMAA